MQGTDLSQVVLGRKSTGPDSAFFQIFGPFKGDGTEDGWRGVRTSRYMYARFESRPWVLYDLDKDPYEQKNLVEEPGARALMAEMEKRLKGWMERTGDSWKYDWHEPVEDAGRLYRHGTFYTVEEYLEWARQHPEQAAPPRK
jgi:arylsulfatase A-like enzyme